MFSLFRFLMAAAAAIIFQAPPVSAGQGVQSCRATSFRGGDYLLCSFDPAQVDLRLFHGDASGRAYGSFETLSQALWRQRAFLDFAMNGGMYHDDLSPVGLFIENGVEKRPIVLSAGYGNFHLLPNGVFHFGDGKAGVSEAAAFAASGMKPRYATQSGPMLVIGGTLHPRFLPDSDSFKIRNGVGVSRDGRVHFAISRGRVRFYDFALLFRDELDCPDALYLDGSVSSAIIPTLGRYDRLFPMGPMIGVVSRLPD